jgi:O-succinylbenzoate synthase
MDNYARLYRYRIPLKPPLNIIREGLLIELDGGWGEIAPLPGFSQETLSDAICELKKIWPLIRTAKSSLPSVQWGLHCAKQPWPPKPFQRTFSALVWDAPVPSGYKTAKLKVKNLSIQEAIRRVKRVQEQDCAIRLDCNSSWTLDQALEFASHFHPEDFAYIEEPLQKLKDLKTFSLKTKMPLALDESLDKLAWQKIPTLKAIVIKPMVWGFIPEIPSPFHLIVGGVYESGIGTLHAAAYPAYQPAGLDTYRYLCHDILKTPLRMDHGQLIWDGQFEIDRSKIIEICVSQKICRLELPQVWV